MIKFLLRLFQHVKEEREMVRFGNIVLELMSASGERLARENRDIVLRPTLEGLHRNSRQADKKCDRLAHQSILLCLYRSW
jgi:hypothetical protein